MTININNVKQWTIDIFSQKSTYFSIYAPTPKQGTKLPYLNNVFSILEKIQFSSKFQFYIEIKPNSMRPEVSCQTTEFTNKPLNPEIIIGETSVASYTIPPEQIINNKIDCSIVMDSIKDAVIVNPTITDQSIQDYIQKLLVIRKIPEKGTLDDFKQYLNKETWPKDTTKHIDPLYANIISNSKDYTTLELITHLTTHYAYSTNLADVGKVRVGPFVRAIAKVHKKKTYIDLSFTKKGNKLTDIKAKIYYYDDTQANIQNET